MSAASPAKATEIGDPVPDILSQWLQPFQGAFTAPTWQLALVLVAGAILAPGKRTVTACLRITGRTWVENFSSYHQVLNRARWNPRHLAKILARLLVNRLVDKEDPLIIGLDDTIERRWGPRISARGIYRDPVRSSKGHFVKTSGLRWLSCMLLTPVPGFPGIKALPILTLLAPSERWAKEQGLRHKPLTERARQAMLLIWRWFPGRRIIFVGDGSFGTHDLAYAVGKFATLISRLRLDATLYEPPPPRTPGQRGRPRLKGERLPPLRSLLTTPAALWTTVTVSRWYGDNKEKILEIRSGLAIWYRAGSPPKTIRWVLTRDPEGKAESQAFFSTDIDMDPVEIIAVFVRRWQIEVTFQEARAHLGVETQRQWSDLAINRTTPVLFGLYSLIYLWSLDIIPGLTLTYAAAWYPKYNNTFSDAIAAVRTQLWLDGIFSHSPPGREQQKIPDRKSVDQAADSPISDNAMLYIPAERFHRMVQALCFAA